MVTREQRVVLTGVALSIPATYLVYTLTGSFPLAGATLLGLGFVIPSGINGYRDEETTRG
jgi:hypothetical protein